MYLLATGVFLTVTFVETAKLANCAQKLFLVSGTFYKTNF